VQNLYFGCLAIIPFDPWSLGVKRFLVSNQPILVEVA